MKRILRYILVAPVALMTVAMTGCSESDADKDQGKDPKVAYFRYTDPATANEHITEAYLGEKIAICGSDMGDVQQVLFFFLMIRRPPRSTQWCPTRSSAR